MGLVDTAVTQYDIVDAGIDRLLSFATQIFQGIGHPLNAFLLVKQDGENLCVESLVAYVAEGIKLCVSKNRLWQTHHLAVVFAGSENVHSYRTNIFGERHDKFFAYRVNGRVGDLSKLLTEVIEKQLWTVRKYCQLGIIAHG